MPLAELVRKLQQCLATHGEPDSIRLRIMTDKGVIVGELNDVRFGMDNGAQTYLVLYGDD